MVGTRVGVFFKIDIGCFLGRSTVLITRLVEFVRWCCGPMGLTGGVGGGSVGMLCILDCCGLSDCIIGLVVFFRIDLIGTLAAGDGGATICSTFWCLRGASFSAKSARRDESATCGRGARRGSFRELLDRRGFARLRFDIADRRSRGLIA